MSWREVRQTREQHKAAKDTEGLLSLESHHAKGSPAQSVYKRMPSQQNVCLVCGKAIDRSHRWCADCSQKNSEAALVEGAKLGRLIAHGPQAQARLKATKLHHDKARAEWSPSSRPAWLTERVYASRIQPQLKGDSLSQIATAIGVSIPYASDIQKGRRRPHPRHWLKLAGLVGDYNAGDLSAICAGVTAKSSK